MQNNFQRAIGRSSCAVKEKNAGFLKSAIILAANQGVLRTQAQIQEPV
jgi:hypothetical protein